MFKDMIFNINLKVNEDYMIKIYEEVEEESKKEISLELNKTKELLKNTRHKIAEIENKNNTLIQENEILKGKLKEFESNGASSIESIAKNILNS